jgi:hypothetical protein
MSDRRTRAQNGCPTPRQCSHPDICQSHGCAALEVQATRDRKDDIRHRIRAAMLPILLEDGKDPDPAGAGSADTWLIPATKADAAGMLDDLVEAVIGVVKP